MTPEREVELFAKLDLLLELYRRMEGDLRDLREDQRTLRSEVRGDIGQLRTDVGQLRGAIGEIAERTARVEGRLEEQSKFLQLVLASRQPRGQTAA